MNERVVKRSDVPATGESATLGARLGDVVFISGLTGLEAGQSGSRTGIDEQARTLFQNAGRALEALGASLSDVVQARFYVTDWRYLLPLNAAYAEVFPAPYTARSTVRSASLSRPEVLLEASFIAVRGGNNRVLGHEKLFKLPVPLAQAGVLAGDWFFGTGVVPVDLELRAPDGIEAQTARALDNQALALEAAGLTFDDVVKATLFLRDPRCLDGMLAAYRGFFRPPHPALAVVITTLARPEWLVEVEVVAARGEKLALLAPGADVGDRPGWSSRPVDKLAPTLRPESAAVVCDGWLYSGAGLGLDGEGRPADGLEAQVAGAADQLDLLLSAADCGPADVLFAAAAVTDWRHAAGFEQAFRAAFPPPGPARLLVEALTPDPRLLTQIEIVASRGAGSSAHRVVRREE